jgi:hypothetical protein
MLMMFDRIVALEDIVDKQNKEIIALKIKTQYSYDLTKMNFSNGGTICWNILQHPDTLKIQDYACGKYITVTDDHWNANILFRHETIDENDMICMKFPTDPMKKAMYPIKFKPSEMNVRKYCMLIYELYATKISDLDICIDKNIHGHLTLGQYFIMMRDKKCDCPVVCDEVELGFGKIERSDVDYYLNNKVPFFNIFGFDQEVY